MKKFEKEKIEAFANYCIDNNLIDEISNISDLWAERRSNSLRKLFLERLKVTDANYKTEKKDIYDFADYFIPEGIEDQAYWFDALQVSIYEQLHNRRYLQLQDLKKYFAEKASCLNIRGIELEAELPAKTLDHFLKERRSLNDEALDKLLPVITDLGYKPLQ